MSVQAPTRPVTQSAEAEHSRLARRARALSWLSIAWMTIEAGVATIAALTAGSVALLGFGLDSLIELASASIVIWRFTGARARSDAAERRAQQFIAACFAALAAYLILDAFRIVATGARPDASWPGAIVAGAAVILMPWLSLEKGRVAAQLGSAATAGDAAQSKLCAIAAAGVLASILANAALGWWWLDPAIGFAIAGLAIHEYRKAWAGEACGDCAPIGFQPPTTPAACGCDHDHGS